MEPQQHGMELSQNGIIEISSGFDGPYILQVIACRITPTKQYHLCLSDGKLYIGGKYQTALAMELPLYSVVRIQCKFVSRWSPIQISSLEIINDKIGSLLGRAPFTLHDYFIEQKQSSDKNLSESQKNSPLLQHAQQLSEMANTRKQVKISSSSHNKGQIQQQVSLLLAETQTKKIPLSNVNIQRIQNTETQNLKYVSQNSFDNSQLKIKSVSKQPQQNLTQFQKQKGEQIFQQPKVSKLAQTLMKPKMYMIIEQQVPITKPQTKKYETHNAYISQLYERMLRWKILCRIVSIRKFISMKGKKCAAMYLIDQRGDHIRAMYYGNAKQSKQVDNLDQGKVYLFSGGDIKQVASPDEKQYLQITFNTNSEIQQRQQIFIYPYCSKKLTKYRSLLQNPYQVNLIGMLKSWEILSANSSQYKSKPRIKGVVCNPLQLCQVQFSKPFYQGETQPTFDAIYVLANFAVVQMENAIKIIGTSHSYLIKIHPEDIRYKAPQMAECIQLNKLSQDFGEDKKKWRKYEYYNLSQIKYSKRTIQEMKQISNQQQSIIYSQILVSIAEIQLKKQYMACPVCKKSTIQPEYVLYQCLKCKKIVDPTPAIIIGLTLADATGSFEVDAIGDKVKIFLEVDISEFSGLSNQDKQCNLQIARFSQFVVKVKTEKKSAKQIIYNLQEASKQQHNLTMKQIRRRTVQQKLKMQQKWQSFQ